MVSTTLLIGGPRKRSGQNFRSSLAIELGQLKFPAKEIY